MLLSVTFAVILVPRLTVSFGLWPFCAEQVETQTSNFFFQLNHQTHMITPD